MTYQTLQQAAETRRSIYALNKNLQFPSYAANFPVWADHANAMTQYAVWTTLAAAGVGANLQHYNPLPDAAIAKEWNIPESWLLRAQMVIGGIEAPVGEKAFEPVENRLKVFGA